MRGADHTTFMFRFPLNLGASSSWKSQALSRHVMGLLYLMCVCVCVCIYIYIYTVWRTKCHTIDCAHFLAPLASKGGAQLRAHIVKLCRALSEDLCRKVVANSGVRLQEAVRQNGGHIEHVLH